MCEMAKRRHLVIAAGAFAIASSAQQLASAHCDTLDGPVVTAAKRSLERGDVTPVLKWVRPEFEGQVRRAFSRTMVVRNLGAEARKLADLYFFETLVRLHRLGEGAPYTGVKPAGTGVDPAVAAADRALEVGSVDRVIDRITQAVATGIRDRFTAAAAKRETSERNVEDGRAYVAAYVEFVHYVERIHHAVTDPSAHAHGAPKATAAAAHEAEHGDRGESQTAHP